MCVPQSVVISMRHWIERGERVNAKSALAHAHTFTRQASTISCPRHSFSILCLRGSFSVLSRASRSRTPAHRSKSVCVNKFQWKLFGIALTRARALAYSQRPNEKPCQVFWTLLTFSIRSERVAYNRVFHFTSSKIFESKTVFLWSIVMIDATCATEFFFHRRKCWIDLIPTKQIEKVIDN